MLAPRRPLLRVLFAAAITLHVLGVAQAWRSAQRSPHARDFASYYYAYDVAQSGGDPYAVQALGAAARDDGTRAKVHPYFYPPPFLALVSWTGSTGLHRAYLRWFWLHEAFVLLAAWLLWRWWRPMGSSVGVTLALTLACMTALPNNLSMGQANLGIFLLVVAALYAEDRKRPTLAGAAMGTACMFKMSPGLLVAWWLLRRRWVAAATACAAAVVWTVVALSWVDAPTQWRFYTETLPQFGSGRYNGLAVGIDLFGNHSIANLYDTWFPAPGGRHRELSAVAHALSTATAVAVVGGLGWAFRRGGDGVARAGQVGAVLVAMLVLPVFTYEHHLVVIVPSIVAAVLGVQAGRLRGRWPLVVGFAAAILCFDLTTLKTLHGALSEWWWLPAAAVRELKFAALVALGAACVRVGTSIGEVPEEA